MKTKIYKCWLICTAFALSNLKVIQSHVFDENIFLENLKSNPVIEQLYYPYLNKTLNLINFILHDPQSAISDQCAKNLNQIKNGLLKKERWALLYYESNGFPKNGRLNGDYSDLGYFDQCLSVGEKEMKRENFDTKFCLISLSTPEWNQLANNRDFNNYFNPLQELTKEMLKFNLGKIFGVCLPSSCQTQSLIQSVNRILLPIGLNATSQKYCSTKASKETDNSFAYTEIVAILIFGCTSLLCILSQFHKQNNFLSHFSLSKNYSRIYDYDQNDLKIRSTDYLHGLKTTMIAFSIMLHCCGVALFQAPLLYSKARYHHAGNFQIFLDRAFLFADQLFFYGGFFAMFSWYDLIKKMNITVYRYVFTKFIRIFVVSVMVILLVFLMPRISSGPYYLDLMKICSSNCAKNFWKNLLFINNFDSFLEICWLPTWYLSADFQLYLLNFFLMNLLVKKPRSGLLLAGIELIVGSLIVIIHDYFKNIPYYYKLTTRLDSLSTFKFEEHYLPTFYHSNTFVIGILCAWAIKSELKFKFLELKINRSIVTTTASLSLLIAMTLPELWERNLIYKNDLLIIIWSVVDKFLISLSISWVFYSIGIGYYMIYKNFFSLRCWIPVSQISFSMIMCQFFYFFYLAGTQKFLYNFDSSSIMKEFLFSFTVTFLISNLTFLFFEMPVTNLLLKAFNLNRRRDIKLVEKQAEVVYNYDEINNNNPYFKIIKKLD